MVGANAVLKSIQSVNTKIAGLVKYAASAGAALAGLAGVGSLAGFAAGIKNAASLGSKVSEISQRTGLAVKDIVILRQAFEESGISADNLQKAIGYMDKALVRARDQGGETAKAFGDLGLKVDDLINLDPGKKFLTIANAISQVGNSTERSAIAMRIFEEGGSQFLSLFSDSGAIEKASRTVGGLADTLQRNAGAFDSINDSINAMGVKAQQFFTGFLGQIDEIVIYFLDQINSIDFTNIGEKAGAFVKLVKQYWNEGKVGELVVLTLNSAFEQIEVAWNKLVNRFSFKDLFGRLLQGFVVFIGKLAVKFNIMIFEVSRTATRYLGAALMTVGDKFVQSIQTQLASMPLFRTLFPDAVKQWENASTSWKENWDENMKYMVEKGTPFFDFMINKAQETNDSIDILFGPRNIDQVSATPYTDLLSKQLSQIINDEHNREIKAANEMVSSVGKTTTRVIESINTYVSATLTAARQAVQQTENAITAISNNWRIIAKTKENMESMSMSDYMLGSQDSQKQSIKNSLLEKEKRQAIDLYNALGATIKEYDALAAKAKASGDEKTAREYTSESSKLQREQGAVSSKIQKISVELDAPNLNDFSDQIMLAIVNLENSFGTLAENIRESVESVVESMRDGMSDFFYDTLSGAKTGKKALTSMWETWGKAALRAISDTISNFTMSKTVMIAMEYAWSAAMLAINAATNGAYLAEEAGTAATLKSIWKGPALLRSVITFGAAAVVGLAAMAGVMALTGGFATGGRVQGEKQKYWLNERGSEYVVSANSPSANDIYLDYANKGGLISDLVNNRDDVMDSNFGSTSNTYNSSVVNNNNQSDESRVIVPEINVWSDSSRNTRRRATERAQSKRMKQILRRA